MFSVQFSTSKQHCCSLHAEGLKLHSKPFMSTHVHTSVLLMP